MRLYIKKSLPKQEIFFGILVLLVTLLFGAEFAICQDFFMGKVLSVDEDKMEIILHPQYGIPMSGTDSDVKTIRIRVAEVNSLPWDGQASFFPRCVVVGNTIRLWGQKVPNETNVFLVTDIRGCKGGGCSDPTGVRLRLLQKQQDSRYPDHEPASMGQESGGNGHGANGGKSGGGGR